MDKSALLGHLARLGATDVGETPRLLMRHRGPAELAQLQHAGNNLLQPLKNKLTNLPGVLRKPAGMLLDHPEAALALPIPVPGASALAMGGKALMERAIDRFLPLQKAAFNTNEYSGPMGPVKFKQESDIPAFKVPRLDRAIQKAAESPAMPWDGSIHGGGRQESDQPPYRKPQLERGLQRNNGETSMPTGASITDKPQLPSSDKQAMLSLSTEKLAEFVAELTKEGIAGLTPMSQLNQSSRVGAPKATAPPGPSIAQIAKPSGAKFNFPGSKMGFGSGISGAFKGGIGGTGPVGLK